MLHFLLLLMIPAKIALAVILVYWLLQLLLQWNSWNSRKLPTIEIRTLKVCSCPAAAPGRLKLLNSQKTANLFWSVDLGAGYRDPGNFLLKGLKLSTSFLKKWLMRWFANGILPLEIECYIYLLFWVTFRKMTSLRITIQGRAKDLGNGSNANSS